MVLHYLLFVGLYIGLVHGQFALPGLPGLPGLPNLPGAATCAAVTCGPNSDCRVVFNSTSETISASCYENPDLFTVGACDVGLSLFIFESDENATLTEAKCSSFSNSQCPTGYQCNQTASVCCQSNDNSPVFTITSNNPQQESPSVALPTAANVQQVTQESPVALPTAANVQLPTAANVQLPTAANVQLPTAANVQQVTEESPVVLPTAANVPQVTEESAELTTACNVPQQVTKAQDECNGCEEGYSCQRKKDSWLSRWRRWFWRSKPQYHCVKDVTDACGGCEQGYLCYTRNTWWCRLYRHCKPQCHRLRRG